MKTIMRLAAALLIVAAPFPAFSQHLSGDVTGGGSFSGTVTSAGAWVQANPVDGTEVNFWTLTGNAGDLLSIIVSSSQLEFGVSVYQGVVEPLELLIPGFANDGDFGDNVFVAGTPSFGAAGTSLLNITLPFAGIYTIAVGGEGFGFESSYAYNMDVAVAPVPLPAAVWLLGSALLGMGALRRRAV
ncbi:hypothetical protein HNQ60_000117 [Povalibacter uvarum]|uniref:Secreted protein n=1 Tax=Povalibacter uvarum TaxID=732238 RepID=A0A841HDU2_9GAMM|nr:VPLPA-CTERM sorting domain-containing protein [Povalibacter uvarum]MBB6091271.1 hypothetical protein [Povalibacter uvarum]